MAWDLTVAVGVGDLDTTTYGEIRITSQRHDSGRRKFILLNWEYGNTVDDVWVPGMTPSDKSASAMIDGTAYDTFIAAHTSLDAELTFVAAKRGLYTWLYDNGHIDAGSVT